MDKEEKKLFDSKLEFGTDAITHNDCPSVFKRDIILNLFKYVFTAGLFGAFSKFFLSEDMLNTLISLENYAMLFLLNFWYL
ncbi:hypothetical protein KJ877_07620 [bacterium]|nr:hypothetical protein [bacterium]MBU1989818.1 hypothetical protein [bacterium]